MALAYLLSSPLAFVYFLRTRRVDKSSMKNPLNQKDVICFRSDDEKNLIQQLSSFDWKKNVEDSIKNGLIITAAATGIYFVLQAAGVKPPKASLDAMDIMKLTGGICGGALVKDYAVYKKWINE